MVLDFAHELTLPAARKADAFLPARRPGRNAGTIAEFVRAHRALLLFLLPLLNPGAAAAANNYDPNLGDLTCTDRINAITRYTFDPNNNLLTVTDADAIAQNTLKNTSYAYDPRNLLTSETFPDGKTRNYSYDAANRLASRLDQAGVTTSYQYDFVSRLIQRQYPDSLNNIYGFDPASRLVSAQSLRYGNTITRTFDPGSRLTSENLSINGQQFNIGYAYDAGNRQTTMTYPDASVLTRGFTDRNEVQQLTYNGLSAATIYHDRNGRVYQAAAGNGLFTSFQFYNDNLLSEIDGPSYLKYTYTFDANKRKTADNDAIYPANSQALGYDNEDRLTSFTRNNGDAQNWNLSLVGDWQNFTANGVAQLRVHDAVHELTQINATVLSYDAKGNLLTNANGQVYTWDNENRLTKAVNGATTASYSYDALGRRVGKTVNGASTIFVSDGLQEIAEYENGAAPTAPARSYVFGEYIDQPLMMAAGTQRYYYHTNNQYSVTSLTDQNRNIVEFYRYDPYGKATAIAPDGVTIRPQSSVGNPWTFTGRRLDGETGLMQYRTRMYDSTLGRFIGRDPWRNYPGDETSPGIPVALDGYPNGFNRYEFLSSSPANGLDFMGLCESAQAMVINKKLQTAAVTYQPPRDFRPTFSSVSAKDLQALEQQRQAMAAAEEATHLESQIGGAMGSYSPNADAVAADTMQQVAANILYGEFVKRIAIPATNRLLGPPSSMSCPAPSATPTVELLGPNDPLPPLKDVNPVPALPAPPLRPALPAPPELPALSAPAIEPPFGGPTAQGPIITPYVGPTQGTLIVNPTPGLDLFALPTEEQMAIQATLQHIDAGTVPSGPTATKWGTLFNNRIPPNGDPLPGDPGARPTPYTEYRVSPAPGISTAGERRIVVNQVTGEIYYTSTHYGDSAAPSFRRIFR